MGLFHRHIYHDPVLGVVHQYDTTSPFEFDVGHHFGPVGEHHIGRPLAVIAGIARGAITHVALWISMAIIACGYGIYQLGRHLFHPMVLGGIAASISLYYTMSLMTAILFG